MKFQNIYSLFRDQTARMFDAEDCLKSGDSGSLDKDGFLKIKI